MKKQIKDFCVLITEFNRKQVKELLMEKCEWFDTCSFDIDYFYGFKNGHGWSFIGKWCNPITISEASDMLAENNNEFPRMMLVGDYEYDLQPKKVYSFFNNQPLTDACNETFISWRYFKELPKTHKVSQSDLLKAYADQNGIDPENIEVI